MTNLNQSQHEDLTACGRRGSPADVDLLMAALVQQTQMALTKTIDHALSLVNTAAGQERIRYYLLHGEAPIQRNYAALYFKRLGNEDLLARAVALGKIDAIQAFSQ